jgi:hypothetical protein
VDNFVEKWIYGVDFMALVWADPFDQYGGTASLIPQSGYSQSPSTLVNPGRTGTWGMGGAIPAIRALNTPTNKVGQGFAVFANGTAPYTNTNSTTGGRWYSAGNTVELVVGGNLQLGVSVYDRTNALIGSTAPNLLLSGGWTWIEAVAIQNTGGVGTGSVEVRINGVQRLVINGVNLPNQFTAHGIGGFFGSFTMDDWITWDGSGANNNNFMGDRRLLVCYPNANGALQDFTPSVGNAFDRVNDAPPVDTSYIEGALAGNISEFPKDAISLASTDIAAVVVMGRIFKTDAGVATGRIGINSNATVNNSAELFPGTTGTFFQYPIELDPNGAIPWTKAAADAASIRLTRQQ